MISEPFFHQKSATARLDETLNKGNTDKIIDLYFSREITPSNLCPATRGVDSKAGPGEVCNPGAGRHLAQANAIDSGLDSVSDKASATEQAAMVSSELDQSTAEHEDTIVKLVDAWEVNSGRSWETIDSTKEAEELCIADGDITSTTVLEDNKATPLSSNDVENSESVGCSRELEEEEAFYECIDANNSIDTIKQGNQTKAIHKESSHRALTSEEEIEETGSFETLNLRTNAQAVHTWKETAGLCFPDPLNVLLVLVLPLALWTLHTILSELLFALSWNARYAA